MFYTDTNEQAPIKRSLAMILLEAAMETRLPYELKIEEFNELRAGIGKLIADFKWRFEE